MPYLLVRLASTVSHINVGHLEGAVVGLLLNEVQRHSGAGHVCDAGVLQGIKLQVLSPSQGGTDEVRPEPAYTTLIRLLGTRNECIVLSRAEQVTIARGAKIKLQQPRDHLVRYCPPAGVVVFRYVLADLNQLPLDAYVAYTQREDLLVAH